MKVMILSLCMWLVVYAFDPTKVNYCKQPCKDEKNQPVKHTACGHCKLEKGHTEILEDIMTFREAMVQTHNEFRNKIANGGEKKLFGFPSAADMKAISYDMEMEYIARCHARRFVNTHDSCRNPDGYEGAGQNIYFSSEKEMEADPTTKWYKEIKNVDGDKDKYLANYVFGSDTAHFSQVIWAKVSIIGCARVWIEGTEFPFVLICNYADKESVGNTLGAVVYKVGTPCTDCSSSCNKKYTALCGEIKIPNDKPYDIKDIAKDDEEEKKRREEEEKRKKEEEEKKKKEEEERKKKEDEKKKEANGTNDDNYGYDGLDVDYKPKISTTTRVSSSITLLFVVTIVVR